MHRRLVLSMCAALSISVGALNASDARAADSTLCNNTSIHNTTVGKVVVAEEAECTLFDATVNGNIDVQSGASLFIEGGVTVNGNISILHGSGGIRIAAFSGPNTFNGNITIDSSLQVLICNTNINGKVAISNTNPGFVKFGGFPLIFPGCRPLPPDGHSNTVGGNVSISNNQGEVDVTNNDVGGNVSITDNQKDVNVTNNNVGKSMTIKDNLADTSVLENNVDGDLTCSGNAMLTLLGNKAKNFKGQCTH